jgi:hypothetical protein
MLALLKLIPIKDYVYGAVIIALLTGFGWYTFHERAVGEKKIEMADAKIAAAQIIHDQEVATRVKAELDTALANYETPTAPPPPAPVPVLVCHKTGGSNLPGGPGPVAASNGAGTNPAAPAAQADAGFDPAPAVSADGTAYDALIDHYLAKIKLLQQTVKAYQDGGLVAK